MPSAADYLAGAAPDVSNQTGFASLMDETFGRGRWRQTSGYRSPAKEDALRAGGAGTVTLAIGPTSTPANTLISSETATLGQMLTIRLPSSWYLKWSATTATFTQQKAIGC